MAAILDFDKKNKVACEREASDNCYSISLQFLLNIGVGEELNWFENENNRVAILAAILDFVKKIKVARIHITFTFEDISNTQKIQQKRFHECFHKQNICIYIHILWWPSWIFWFQPKCSYILACEQDTSHNCY